MAWKTMEQLRAQHLILNYEHREWLSGEWESPRCPECGSDYLTNGMDQDDNITVVCRACGHEWLPEDGEY